MDGKDSTGCGEYHENKYLIQVLSLSSLVCLLFLFFPEWHYQVWLILTLQIPSDLQTGVIVLSTIIIVVIIHERIHAISYRLFGYDPEIHLTKVVCLNQYITRKKNLISLLSPLLLIDAVAILLLSIDLIGFLAKVVLVVNTAASMRDVYNSIKVFNYPAGTLFVNVRLDDELKIYYCNSKS